MLTKTCKSCGLELDISKFTPSKNIKDGYENKCRDCRSSSRPKHSLICSRCGHSFQSKSPDAKYCGRKCMGAAKVDRVKVNCAYCNKEILKTPYQKNKSQILYCNIDCKSLHQKQIMAGDGNPNYNRINHVCDGCGVEIKVIPFKMETQKHVFCSKECYRDNIGKFYSGSSNSLYKRVELTCSECDGRFERKPSESKGDNVYCSRACYEKAFVRESSINTAERLEVNCSYCGISILSRKSQIKNQRRVFCSRGCKDKANSIFYSKENHPQWKDEKSYEDRIKERLLGGYKEWRTQIYKRDKHTCRCCGDKRGKNLVAHHLNGWDKFPNQRYELSNGITLCKSCHADFHRSYGYGNNTREQFDEWIASKTQSVESTA